MMEVVSYTVYVINIQYKNLEIVLDAGNPITAVLQINLRIPRIGNVYVVKADLLILSIFLSRLYFKLFLKLRQFIKLAISFNLFSI